MKWRELRENEGKFRGLTSSGLRMLGMILIIIGMLITSLAFVSIGEEGNGVVIIFPFVFGNVGGWASVVFTITLLTFFILSSVIPWYLISRSLPRNRPINIGPEGHRWGSDSETMEYIITTELPGRMRNSIYIESDEEEINLKSSKDEKFLKSYTLPEGFQLDEIYYDYEGNYLVLKLLLKRITGI